MLMITQKYKDILSKAKPYLFCNARNLAHFDLNPLGIEFDKDLLFDCLSTKSSDFFELVTKMDALSFGDQGMGMDRWVLFDCSAMPGAIFGFAVLADDLDVGFKKKMGIPASYKGYVPISMYIAIPTAEPDHWFGHNLSSLNSHLNNHFSGLGLLTKAIGLMVMKIKFQYGATQWNNPALCIHTKLAPLKLLTAYTPIHTHKYSLTYLAQYSNEDIESVLSNCELSRPKENLHLLGNDQEAIKSLQNEIEKGSEFWISHTPKKEGENFNYALHKGSY